MIGMPRTIGQWISLLAIVGLVLYILWSAIFGQSALTGWRLERANNRVATAEQSAANAQANANSANAGAANATQTRAAVTNVRLDATGFADQVADRIERDVRDTGDEAADEEVLADLEAQEARIAKQAGRLTRKRK